MQRLGPKILLSATDLVNFHECVRLTAFDLRALDDKALKAQKTKPDEHTELLFKRGNEFEAAYLADLKREVQGAGGTIIGIRIYQATFLDSDLVGHADFLRKVSRPSALGDYSYEVIDTKLGRTPKPKASYVLQLAFYGTCWAGCSSSTRTRCTWCSARASR